MRNALFILLQRYVDAFRSNYANCNETCKFYSFLQYFLLCFTDFIFLFAILWCKTLFISLIRDYLQVTSTHCYFLLNIEWQKISLHVTESAKKLTCQIRKKLTLKTEVRKYIIFIWILNCNFWASSYTYINNK